MYLLNRWPCFETSLSLYRITTSGFSRHIGLDMGKQETEAEGGKNIEHKRVFNQTVMNETSTLNSTVTTAIMNMAKGLYHDSHNEHGQGPLSQQP